MFCSNKIDWAPPFVFRHSVRAKRMSLLVDPHEGLVIVLPKRFTQKQGLAFLNSQRAWIEKHLKDGVIKTQEQLKNQFALPQKVALTSINQEWPIEYVSIKAAKTVSFKSKPDRLLFYGNVLNFKPCIPHITHWLKQQAKTYLPEMLQLVAKNCQLSYRKVSIRAQKTRWGSCNIDKDIQLNYKLLLMPEDVVNYVMVHELCHTIHMNHSNAFWRLVADYLPNYQAQIKALKNAHLLLPKWL